jgi:catechol 2,3-dioxygenase-like lactoylglutathione lyase family enzyme
MSEIGKVTLLVDDHEAAIDWFSDALGFVVREDADLGGGRRWVVVGPPGTQGAGLVLGLASDAAQRARIGDQTGGRVALFLHTDDFARDHRRMTAAGVRFAEEPRSEPYGTVAVFEDRWGNRWDLIEHTTPAGG